MNIIGPEKLYILLHVWRNRIRRDFRLGDNALEPCHRTYTRKYVYCLLSSPNKLNLLLWLLTIYVINKVHGTTNIYIVSSLKYKAVLMTEIQTANKNVKQNFEYFCEKLNNERTKLH